MCMRRRKSKFIWIGAGVLLVAVLVACWNTWWRHKDMNSLQVRDYPQICADGVLRVTVEYNSTGYYVEGDSLAGFHYELVNAFADSHGLKVAFFPEMSFDRRMVGLENGEYDLLAGDVAGTSELKSELALTVPVLSSKQVLVQRKPKTKNDSLLYIDNLLDLEGKIVHVVKGDPAILRIRNLGEEIGDTIYIVELDRYGPEQLVAMVAYGDINYTVCNEQTARSVVDSFPQLATLKDIGFTQFFSWGVNRESLVLLDSLNVWLTAFQKSEKYEAIYSKYFGNEIY